MPGWPRCSGKSTRLAVPGGAWSRQAVTSEQGRWCQEQRDPREEVNDHRCVDPRLAADGDPPGRRRRQVIGLLVAAFAGSFARFTGLTPGWSTTASQRRSCCTVVGNWLAARETIRPIGTGLSLFNFVGAVGQIAIIPAGLCGADRNGQAVIAFGLYALFFGEPAVDRCAGGVTSGAGKERRNHGSRCCRGQSALIRWRNRAGIGDGVAATPSSPGSPVSPEAQGGGCSPVLHHRGLVEAAYFINLAFMALFRVRHPTGWSVDDAAEGRGGGGARNRLIAQPGSPVVGVAQHRGRPRTGGKDVLNQVGAIDGSPDVRAAEAACWSSDRRNDGSVRPGRRALWPASPRNRSMYHCSMSSMRASTYTEKSNRSDTIGRRPVCKTLSPSRIRDVRMGDDVLLARDDVVDQMRVPGGRPIPDRRRT